MAVYVRQPRRGPSNPTTPRDSYDVVDSRVGELHELRNRVAHHEPLLTEDLQRKHTLLLELADLIEPSLAAHIKATTRVPVLIASRPDQVQDEQDQDDEQQQDDQETDDEAGS